MILSYRFEKRFQSHDILPGNVWWNILDYLEAHDLINLVYISKHLRALVLIKFDKYYKFSTSFCDFGQWKKKIRDNLFNLLSKLYTDLALFFDFELYTIKLMKTMPQPLLISVCLHFLRCFRSCDKLPKSKFCFYCSHVRARNHEKPIYFLDIIVDERDFEEQFCKMVSKCIDLDTLEERPITFDYPKFNRKCDFHEEICTTRCLHKVFISVVSWNVY